MRLSRRGIALAEVMVALLLTVLLVGSALGGLTTLQRSLARQVARTTRDQTLRSAVQLGVAELRDLAPVAGDLIAVSPAGLVYRAVRATGLACGRVLDGVLVHTASFRSLRSPSPGRDSLSVLDRSGAWRRIGLDAAARAGTCPDGSGAVVLPFTPGLPDPLAGVLWPAPVRLTEVMEIRAYQSGAEWWLGLRSVSSGEAIQPALGPLAPSGLLVRQLDSLGGPAASLVDVRQLALHLRLVTGDSLVRHLTLSPRGWP